MKIIPQPGKPRNVFGVPEGVEAQVLYKTVQDGNHAALFVARDQRQMASVRESLRILSNQLRLYEFPAWDCPPYTRTSPSPAVSSRRIRTLAAAAGGQMGRPVIVLTTASAFLQKLAPVELFEKYRISLVAGRNTPVGPFRQLLDEMGYVRSPSVMEHGEYAVRGGLLDIFPAGVRQPLRLDFFGDVLEGIRQFDVASQRTVSHLEAAEVLPISEVILNEETTTRFRRKYRSEVDMGPGQDSLYTAATQGVRLPGMEHWINYFYTHTCPLTDYLPGFAVFYDDGADRVLRQQWHAVRKEYEERLATPGVSSTDRTAIWGCRPDLTQCDPQEISEVISAFPFIQFKSESAPEGSCEHDAGGRPITGFEHHRAAQTGKLLHHLGHFINEHRRKRNVVIACWSEGSRERFLQLLQDENVAGGVLVENLAELREGGGGLGLMVWRLEHGYTNQTLTVLSEQDVFGQRLARPTQRKKGIPRFLTEGGQLRAGDLVVHVEHGIGRYLGLEAISLGTHRHDCIVLEYSGGDRMLIPVENSEVLSRFGPNKAPLDRLGGAGWQARKARLKKRLLSIAQDLVDTAARRELQEAPRMIRDSQSWEMLLSRFPFVETEDQLQAVEDVIRDLECGRPMDRLICGDVGYGKTEVAIRAAFIAAMAGWQVAVLAPTTLLVRQHFVQFEKRLRDFPLEVRPLSRLTTSRQAAETRSGLASGTVDIAIGTHALLGKRISFQNLGLLIVDEEQNFGVVQKERLKRLRSDIHVLSLTATPIPRTLQLSTAGVRDMSIISTPPIDRLAVRTYVMEFDPIAVRQALLREHYRQGQSFIVVPRIGNIPAVARFLRLQVPEVEFQSAHGQMNSSELAACMNDFYEGKFGVLLSTTIIASGLDIPTANTVIVCNAERFGLAQLYQIRGRVGRSGLRAYAYITHPPEQPLSDQAWRRIKTFAGLDSLGAGFAIASHDLDIRGAGNLLGDEQSGHIREIGFELYQSMLKEAISKLQAEQGDGSPVSVDDAWTPQLKIAVDANIPAKYVPDLEVRLGLYRRMAALKTSDELGAIREELADRFGPIPPSLRTFIDVLHIKNMCKETGITSLSCGPKGVALRFHKNSFTNLEGLIQYLQAQRGKVRVERDRILIRRNWPNSRDYVSGSVKIVDQLLRIKNQTS